MGNEEWINRWKIIRAGGGFFISIKNKRKN